MKTIGMIGGMSWESTQIYYRLINERVNSVLGGLHSAKLMLYSVDFAEVEACQRQGKWERAASIMVNAGARLERAGADFLILCTNTMHKVAAEIVHGTKIPLIHIADATAERLHEAGVLKVGLLGTRYTMTEDFYTGRLRSVGIEVIVPSSDDMETVNSVIFGELCKGLVRDESRRAFMNVIGRLETLGARGIILGCTEIGMLVGQEDAVIPIFDTTVIHATKAAELALGCSCQIL